ncbi:MAG: MiaB/RimO family radical SAM methylthiotransferase [Fibrobacter sp.]|nr:MiaB/RimO family radical SAM methylthiotransferase [Fibrobacter sp.]
MKIAIISQGCAANFGDGEKLARKLLQEALSKGEPAPEIVFTIDPNCAPDAHCATDANRAPDAFYLNVCTVKGNAGALKLLRNTTEKFPEARIYITGCAPKDFRAEALRICPSVTFPDAANGEENLRHPKLRENSFIGIVNIEEGCLDACSFCSTHLVKGRLRSFSPESIVKNVAALVADGCKEIQLTGQDCGCYGFDIGTNLAELVQKILVHVPGDYRIRLGMGNPRHILQYKDALLECYKDERVYKFIHLPVQSGSESVLKGMNRRHTVRDYEILAESFQKEFPLFTLSTDIIVGFPGETEQDFEATCNLVRNTRPTVCNITRFVARAGTVAARFDDASNYPPVPDSIKHSRSAALADIFQKVAQENNSHWIGHEEFVVVEKSGYREGTTIARNSAYRPVAIQGSFPIGQKLRVHITDAEPFALIGEVIA